MLSLFTYLINTNIFVLLLVKFSLLYTQTIYGSADCVTAIHRLSYSSASQRAKQAASINQHFSVSCMKSVGLKEVTSSLEQKSADS